MNLSAHIDFADPRDPQAPRLQHTFASPRQVLAATELSEVHAVLEAVEAAARSGFWCVGWLRYEAAPAFDSAFIVHDRQDTVPLVWFAVYNAPLPPQSTDPTDKSQARITWTDSLPQATFDAAFTHIQQDIALGRYYQVNYTAANLGRFEGDARALFAALQRAQPGAYAAHIDDGNGTQVLSVSPELFFDWHDGPTGGDILTRPMKGTAPRGATPEQDADNAKRLFESAKERAENVMIVDLLRNDLSRIAQAHSVHVPRLFHIEALPTVWQMTSDVSAHTRRGTRLVDVFAALFPCGSVTGAPKIEAMRAIKTLETAPRGVYCGAVGIVRPNTSRGHNGIAATFNVPIRTLELHGNTVRCSVGSGIVWSASAAAEWAEWQHKRAFADRASEPFDVLETLALHNGVWQHGQAHLARMQAAAKHFGYPFDAQGMDACMQQLAAQHPQGSWRVRLLLDAQGRASTQACALSPTPTPVRLALATQPMAESHSEFVRYKTTRRAHYAPFTPAAGSAVFDTVLYNAAGEITECTFGNIAMLLDGQGWVTPPLHCGLLPGIGRAHALKQGLVREHLVHLSDVCRVREWAFINSLRGWLPATMADVD